MLNAPTIFPLLQRVTIVRMIKEKHQQHRPHVVLKAYLQLDQIMLDLPARSSIASTSKQHV